MAQPRITVGPLDAPARQVAGALAIIGGLTALDGFFQALGFLTWIVCAAMMYVGIIFAMGGFKDGTAVFGFPLLILSVLDAWLPLIRSEEHTSELQSRLHLVCRLLLEKKKTRT